MNPRYPLEEMTQEQMEMDEDKDFCPQCEQEMERMAWGVLYCYQCKVFFKEIDEGIQ